MPLTSELPVQFSACLARMYISFFLRQDLMDQSNSQLVITIIIIGLIMTFVSPNINIFAHLFGLIGGAALAPLFLIGASPYRPTMARRAAPDDGKIRFKPDRWKGKQPGQRQFGKVIWIIFALLVLFGLISRFM